MADCRCLLCRSCRHSNNLSAAPADSLGTWGVDNNLDRAKYIKSLRLGDAYMRQYSPLIQVMADRRRSIVWSHAGILLIEPSY